MTSLKSWETLEETDFSGTAHPDLIFAYPGERTDLEGALEVFRMWKDKFRDTKVYVHQVLVDGDSFAAEYQFATTKKSTDKRTVMGTTAVGRVQDGLIILLKEYTDGQVDDLQVEGKLPLDEGAEPFPWPATTGP
ncbi:MAG: nuclear transport factor 2 family protein [Halieaceae bacterium]|nr:nuclear transport factor 2 family protein [Halieaceae bacterium]